MDEKKNFSLTFPLKKQRKCTTCNVQNKDQLHFDYDIEVGLDRVSMRQFEVLEMKINVDEKSHQNEKNQILEENEEKIKLLVEEKDSLTSKTLGQADKIRQLDNANTKKDRAIEVMRKKENEILEKEKERYEKMENNLIEKICNLETQIQQTKETDNEQKEEIEKLKNELTKVEHDLMKMRIDKKCEEQAVQQQIKSLETNLVKRDAEMLIKIESGIKEQFKTLLTQVKTVTENNDKTTINNTGNVQINQTNSNGALHTQRQILPMKKVVPEFTYGRKH